MKVLVNKCPDTGTLFEDDRKYKLHRQKLLRAQRKQEEFNRAQEEFNKWLSVEKEKIRSLEAIEPWFLLNQRTIMDAVNAGYQTGWSYRGWDKFVPEDVFTHLSIAGNYQKVLSNSGNCPRNGVLNWCARDPNLPRGYPGFKIRVGGTLARPKGKNYCYPYSQALHIVGILTGTGGGGNTEFSYDGAIFLDDWSGLKEQVRIIEEDQIVSRLKGKF